MVLGMLLMLGDAGCEASVQKKLHPLSHCTLFHVLDFVYDTACIMRPVQGCKVYKYLDCTGEGWLLPITNKQTKN